MSELSIISAAFYRSKRQVSRMVFTANKFGLSPAMYGIGKPWTSFCHNKLKMLADEVEKIDTKYTLYVDAYDTRFQGGEKAIMTGYRKAGGGLVMSGDKCCWPIKKANRWFRRRIGRWAKFPYLCAGVFMGPTEDLLNSLRIVCEMWEKDRDNTPEVVRDDDQYWWMRAVTEGKVLCSSDHDGKFVVSTAGMRRKEYEVEDGAFRVNGYKTPVVHFNGRTSKGLLALI